MTPSDTVYSARTTEKTTGVRRWSGYDWGVIVLLALLTALFFWRILTPNLDDRASFPPGDFSYQFWAFSTYEARELSIGRLPLWNPYTYAGAPFWADIQSAVFYPPSLLTLVLSGARGFSLFALEIEAVIHFWLAGTFTFLFVRRLTRHRGAALFSAIVFSFGGYLTSYPSQQLAVLETDVWLPLLLYFSDRALVDRSQETPALRPNLPNILAAGLAWGIALLAGHPQSAMFVFYTFLLYAIFLILSYRKRGNDQADSASAYLTPYPQLFSSLLIIILIGLGLSAIAWLPGLEYMQQSVRSAGLYNKMSGGFPLYDPIQMLLPGSVSFYSPLYVGVLPLLLAIWAALSLRKLETTFWGVLAAGAFLLSFGGETFLYTPFYLLVPGFSIFRDQERAAFIFSFALAVLAGYGFMGHVSCQRLRNLQSPLSSLRRVAGWLLVGSIGLVILFFYGLTNSGWQDDSLFSHLLSRSIWLAILLTLVLATTKIIDLRLIKQTARTSNSLLPTPYFLLGTCYLLIATLDLFTVNWKTNIYPSLPEEQTAVPPVVQAIQQDVSDGKVFRVYNEYRIYENYGVPYRLEDTWGASPLRLARYDELHRSLRMERVWELLNVKYVITWREELYAPSEVIYKEMTADGATYVHRLDDTAPRAWIVYQVQEVGENKTLSRLDSFDFDPTQMALIPAGTLPPLVEPPPSEEKGQVKIVDRTPNSLVLNVTTPSDGLLVLSEVFYPGWRAIVDDHNSPILRVNYTLRGVSLPAGAHRLEIYYSPVTFIWGAVLTGVTLGILVTIGLWIVIRRRHKADHDSGTGSPQDGADHGRKR